MHTGLGLETLRGGVTRSELAERWRAFVREADVSCAWGLHGVRIVELAGVSLPPAPIDLRAIARRHERGRVGASSDYLACLRDRGAEAIEVTPPLGRGRAGVRLAELSAIARMLCREGAPRSWPVRVKRAHLPGDEGSLSAHHRAAVH